MDPSGLRLDRHGCAAGGAGIRERAAVGCSHARVVAAGLRAADAVDAVRLELLRVVHVFRDVHRGVLRLGAANGSTRHGAAPSLNTFTFILVAYLGAVVVIAWLGYRRTRTAADFIVAGRTLGALVGGGTLAASQISAGTFVGTVGLHYMAGVCFAWVWPGAWLGWIVSAVFVAPKLRGSGAL